MQWELVDFFEPQCRLSTQGMFTSKFSNMYPKWQRVFDAMTQGADMRRVATKSLVLALSSILFTLPYFHYLICEVSHPYRFLPSFNSTSLLLSQLMLLFILTFLSAMVGFSFSARYQLQGLGDPRGLLSSLPVVLVSGGLMIMLSYFLFDRYFREISPVSYPTNLVFLLSYPFKKAFTDEIIIRFCLITIVVGLLKSKTAGVVIVSLFATIATIKYFHFIGLKVGIDPIFINQFLIGFLANLFLGYLFVARGLLYSMCLGFLFGLKYLLMALLSL